MDWFKTLYQDAEGWLTHPFKKDMSVGQLLLIFVLFLIVAFIVFDMLRILKAWMDSATEAAVEAIT